MFIPYTGSLIQNLNNRFILNYDIESNFHVLLPGFASLQNASKLKNISQYFYDKVLILELKADYEL